MKLIDVDDLLNNLRKLKVLSLEGKDLFTVLARIAVYARITEQPIIAPESLVKHGKWVHNENYESWSEKYICSVCHRNALSDGDYRHTLSNYCPNCGAKMDGRTDHEQ